MKKLFILLAILGITMVSCKSVEDKTIDYCEELYEAVIDNDKEEFRECVNDFCDWYSDLDFHDQEEVEWVLEKWSEKHLDEGLQIWAAASEWFGSIFFTVTSLPDLANMKNNPESHDYIQSLINH